MEIRKLIQNAAEYINIGIIVKKSIRKRRPKQRVSYKLFRKVSGVRMKFQNKAI